MVPHSDQTDSHIKSLQSHFFEHARDVSTYDHCHTNCHVSHFDAYDLVLPDSLFDSFIPNNTQYPLCIINICIWSTMPNTNANLNEVTEKHRLRFMRYKGKYNPKYDVIVYGRGEMSYIVCIIETQSRSKSVYTTPHISHVTSLRINEEYATPFRHAIRSLIALTQQKDTTL